MKSAEERLAREQTSSYCKQNHLRSPPAHVIAPEPSYALRLDRASAASVQAAAPHVRALPCHFACDRRVHPGGRRLPLEDEDVLLEIPVVARAAERPRRNAVQMEAARAKELLHLGRALRVHVPDAVVALVAPREMTPRVRTLLVACLYVRVRHVSAQARGRDALGARSGRRSVALLRRRSAPSLDGLHRDDRHTTPARALRSFWSRCG